MCRCRHGGERLHGACVNDERPYGEVAGKWWSS